MARQRSRDSENRTRNVPTALPPSSRNGAPTFWYDIEAHGLARPSFPTLEADIAAVDCAVVGAGIVGLKLARHLAQYGLSVAVLEGTSIGDQAASARNQGCLQRVVGDYVAMGDDAAPMERLGLEGEEGVAQACTTLQMLLQAVEAAEAALALDC